MTDTNATKLTIRGDRPTAIASAAVGANLDAVGFNLTFIALRRPELAIELMKLYSQTNRIQENDPKAPDEDFDLFSEELRNLQ